MKSPQETDVLPARGELRPAKHRESTYCVSSPARFSSPDKVKAKHSRSTLKNFVGHICQRQLIILKRKHDLLDTELTHMKNKVKRLESRQGSRANSMTEKCPMCKKDVRKPMRLQQCARGHIICDDCHHHLQLTAKKKNKKLCVTCKAETYCGRPTVLERLLGLLDNDVTIDDEPDDVSNDNYEDEPDDVFSEDEGYEEKWNRLEKKALKKISQTTITDEEEKQYVQKWTEIEKEGAYNTRELDFNLSLKREEQQDEFDIVNVGKVEYYESKEENEDLEEKNDELEEENDELEKENDELEEENYEVEEENDELAEENDDLEDENYDSEEENDYLIDTDDEDLITTNLVKLLSRSMDS